MNNQWSVQRDYRYEGQPQKNHYTTWKYTKLITKRRVGVSYKDKYNEVSQDLSMWLNYINKFNTTFYYKYSYEHIYTYTYIYVCTYD